MAKKKSTTRKTAKKKKAKTAARSTKKPTNKRKKKAARKKASPATIAKREPLRTAVPGKKSWKAAFMERLGQRVDPARFDKAMSMLKADRFQLYAKVLPTELIGVVKSQIDAELVYSCRLTSIGDYSCCTQKLNACGGLNGNLCKHLLVLIMGLAEAEEMGIETIEEWMFEAKFKQPSFEKDEKDRLGSTLLDYKAAEAGEVDWRPTETTPEDFADF
jgi:hypothetical protein